METGRLRPGQTIKLTTDSQYYREVYDSTLLAVYENTLEISSPYHNGIHVPLNTGTKLDMNIRTEFGMVPAKGEIKERFMGRRSLLVEIHDSPAAEYEGRENRCRFVAVSSGKGGVGKTVFVINYAVALARRGKKVVVIDADLGMANVDVLLKLSPRHNLTDVVRGRRNLISIILDGPGGIKFIPGGSGIQELANLSDVQFRRITSEFEYLEKNFDYVLIDTGAGLSKNVTSFVYCADETVVVTTPEPHAITDAYSFIKIILERTGSVNLKLLINRCSSNKEAEQVSDKMKNVIRRFLNYNIELMGYMQESRFVTKSVKEQVPFALLYPDCTASRNIRRLVEHSCGEDSANRSSIPRFITRFSGMFTR